MSKSKTKAKNKTTKRTRVTQKRKRLLSEPVEVPSMVHIKDSKVRGATSEIFEHYRVLLSEGKLNYDDYSILRGFVGGICAMSKVNTLKLTERQSQEVFKNLMVLIRRLMELQDERPELR